MATKAQLEKAWRSSDEKLQQAAAEIMVLDLIHGRKPVFSFDDLDEDGWVCFTNVFMEKINDFSADAYDVTNRLRKMCSWSKGMIMLLVRFSSEVMLSSYRPENYEAVKNLLWKGKYLYENEDRVTVLIELMKSVGKNPRMLPILEIYVREFRRIPVPSMVDVYIGLWKEMFDKLTPEYWEKAFDLLLLFAVYAHRFDTVKAVSVLVEMRRRYGHYREWVPRFENLILSIVRLRKNLREIDVWETDKIFNCCGYSKSFGLKILAELLLTAKDDDVKKNIWHHFTKLRTDYCKWFVVPLDSCSENAYRFLKIFANEGGCFLEMVQKEIFYSIMGAVGTDKNKKYDLKKIVDLSLKNCKGNLYTGMTLGNLMQAYAWHRTYSEQEFLSKAQPLIKAKRFDPECAGLVFERICNIYQGASMETAAVLSPVIETLLKNSLQSMIVTEEHKRWARKLYRLVNKRFDIEALLAQVETSMQIRKESDAKLLRILKKELQ